jgi:ribonuclease HII
MSKIVGIDEVGRGCWAGPLVAAAVVLRRPIAGLTDSKLLSRAQRERLAVLIYEYAAVGVGWVSPGEVDELGLTAAVARAMSLAVEALDLSGEIYDEVVIDGNYNYLSNYVWPRARSPAIKVQTMVKADLKVAAVSAASIVAKVARDNFMTDAARQYPAYQFESHVGYGTSVHLERLKLHGVCPLHRLSYKPIQRIVASMAEAP